eukprot:TRINITY_DN8769_c0_g1_i1.p1 TRINITY_DN8769_c0_g1~~TRINITY_DN8769_c0_g1_i1.p1  ORF type:complete len:921 (-),score=189.89 TRINITY_DN8769_c0_g1_i1:1124-3715(-)
MTANTQLLLQEMGYVNAEVCIASDPQKMIDLYTKVGPSLVVCPFMTKMVPDTIWKNTLTWIIHPGRKGDRGPCSLDYTIKDDVQKWGSTIIEAVNNFDDGPVWGSVDYLINRKDMDSLTKTSLYQVENVVSSMKALRKSIYNWENNRHPIKLSQHEKKWRPLWKQKNRNFSWNDSAVDISAIIKASDGKPGAPIEINGKKYIAYGSHFEYTLNDGKYQPGQIMYRRNKHICIACGKYAIWITALRNLKERIKHLPENILPKEDLENIPVLTSVNEGWNDIRSEIYIGVCSIMFDFSTTVTQSDIYRLMDLLREMDNNNDVKIVVLQGDEHCIYKGFNIFPGDNSTFKAFLDLIEVIKNMKKPTVSSIMYSGFAGLMIGLSSTYCFSSNQTVLDTRNMDKVSDYLKDLYFEKCGKQLDMNIFKDFVGGRVLREHGIINDILGDIDLYTHNLHNVVESIDEYINGTNELNSILNSSEHLSLFKHTFEYKGSQNYLNNLKRSLYIDGKSMSYDIQDQLYKYVSIIKKLYKKKLFIVVISAGDRYDTSLYLKNKRKRSKESGIDFLEVSFEEGLSLEKSIIDSIENMNQDECVHGIIVQLPLPAYLNTKKIVKTIRPEKDIDGFHSIFTDPNEANGKNFFKPCTAEAVMDMIHSYKIDLTGKTVVVVGLGPIVGLPIALSAKSEGANVIICDKNTVKIEETTQKADVLISATGEPNLIKEHWVSEKTIVIDCGIALQLENNNEPVLTGDVQESKELLEKVSMLTPVPGGVGPMTVAILLYNVMKAFLLQSGNIWDVLNINRKQFLKPKEWETILQKLSETVGITSNNIGNIVRDIYTNCKKDAEKGELLKPDEIESLDLVKILSKYT